MGTGTGTEEEPAGGGPLEEYGLPPNVVVATTDGGGGGRGGKGSGRPGEGSAEAAAAKAKAKATEEEGDGKEGGEEGSGGTATAAAGGSIEDYGEEGSGDAKDDAKDDAMDDSPEDEDGNDDYEDGKKGDGDGDGDGDGGAGGGGSEKIEDEKEKERKKGGSVQRQYISAVPGGGQHPGTDRVPLVIDPSASDARWRSLPDPNPDLLPPSSPRLAWLLSFPNSGTSYTQALVRTVTGHYVATNYGHKQVHKRTTGLSEPFFADPATFEAMAGRGSVGPFLVEPFATDRTRAGGGYVPTKTHCGGYCFRNCGPGKYRLTDSEFLAKCASGGWMGPDPRGRTDPETGLALPKKVRTTYDPRLVQRTVHLIRNPYDNVVSRYHLEHNRMERLELTDDLERYPRDREGFRAFCHDLNAKFEAEELAYARGGGKGRRGGGGGGGGGGERQDLLRALEGAGLIDVPCFQDFLRYVLWHEHAMAVTSELAQPTLILHYDQYESDLEGTVGRLMEFLDQEATGTPPDFFAGKSYEDDYFTEEERAKVAEAMEILSSDVLWEELRVYF